MNVDVDSTDATNRCPCPVGKGTIQTLGGYNMSIRQLLCTALCLLAAGSIDLEAAAERTTNGYMFGDYYYVVRGSDEKRNAFQFRRIYLTHDVKWNDSLSGRVRLEAKDSGFGKGGTMDPFVKDA